MKTLKEHPLINTLFVLICIGGFVVIYHLTNRSVLCGLAGMLVMYAAMTFAMAMTFLFSRQETKEKIEEATEQFQKNLRETVIQERKLCGQASANMAKVVADRVANKIAAKYIPGMDNDSLRGNVLDFIERAVNEEVDALQKVIEDESAFARKG